MASYTSLCLLAHMSVMLLTVVLMTGESKLDIGNRTLAALLATITVLIVATSSFTILRRPSLPQSTPQPTEGILAFVWMFRPWDLLILIVIFAAAMIGVVNLLSKEKST